MSQDRILVIKLSALGDFVQAFGPFAAIRAHHPGARIVLLTTAPYAELGERSPWFDEVWIDDRPKWWRFGKVRALRERLRGGDFARVYDLQTSERTSWYFRLMKASGSVEWSGVAPGCSHPHANAERDRMHTLDRQAEQLRLAGISRFPEPDLSWLDGDISGFGLPERFVLVVPGGSPHRPEKRWPADRFAELCNRVAAEGLTPVLVGTKAERAEVAKIVKRCPGAISLLGRTSILDLAGLAREAAGAIGNDTGPMHLAVAAGCPSTVLFSRASDPKLCGPRGEHVAIARAADLRHLEVDVVEAMLSLR